MRRRLSIATVLLALAAHPAAAQTTSQSGFADAKLTLYPQEAPNDDTQAIGYALFRWDPTVKWTTWHVNASFEARTDTHEMTEAAVTFTDRTTKRPALAIRAANASWAQGKTTIVLGKQFIQWGKTDIVVPTNFFAPHDDLEVVTTEELAVTGARVTVGNDVDSIDAVLTGYLTPTRAPLFDQRWVVVPPAAQGLPLADAGATYPARPQFGARWNHLGKRFEHSISFFTGNNTLPQFTPVLAPDQTHLDVHREYAQLTAFGGDAAIPLAWFTVKAEAAWFGTTTASAEEYVIYVVQLERQAGEWLFIGGYAGENVTKTGTAFRFAPDLGLAKAFVGRAQYTIDTNRSVVLEAVIRQNGDGLLARAEYSQASGQHMRFTGGFRLIRGDAADFLGQYRLNSSATLGWRYSF
jgi:hypothetical protein